MQYQISSDNMDLTSSMEELTKDKFSRVESRLKDIDEGSKYVRAVLNKAQGPEDQFTVKAVVRASGREYFSDETDFTLETALIKTVEEILRMMDKDRNEDWEQVREAKLYSPDV